MTDQGLAYAYEPRGAAVELLKCRAPEILIEGPAGTGKTRAVLQKLHWVQNKYPGARGLILREFRIALNETVLVTYEKKVLPPGHPAVSEGGTRSHRQKYTYPNGSEIVLGGLDAPERFMSGEYDWIYLAEGTDVQREEAYATVLTRLRNGVVPYQQAIVDCNPGAPSHWLNQRPERKRDDGSPVMVRLLSRHEDNPSVTREYLDTLRNLPPTLRARLYEGRWVASEGLIYAFNRERHVKVIDTANWPRTICGCDDGTRNPFCILRGRVSGDGHLHIEREEYAAGLLEAAKVAHGQALAAGAESIEVDPAALGLRTAMRAAGLPAREANNDVLAGIAKVQQRFGDGTITVDPGCLNLIREVEGYEWLDNAKKDQPNQEANHAMDALRYLVARLDAGGGSMVYTGYTDGEPVPAPPDAAQKIGQALKAPPPDPNHALALTGDVGWDTLV